MNCLPTTPGLEPRFNKLKNIEKEIIHLTRCRLIEQVCFSTAVGKPIYQGIQIRIIVSQIDGVHGKETKRTGNKQLLGPFTTNSPGKLDILGHDSHPLGMDGAEIGILKQTNKIGLSCLLKCKNCMALKSQIRLNNKKRKKVS